MKSEVIVEKITTEKKSIIFRCSFNGCDFCDRSAYKVENHEIKHYVVKTKNIGGNELIYFENQSNAEKYAGLKEARLDWVSDGWYVLEYVDDWNGETTAHIKSLENVISVKLTDIKHLYMDIVSLQQVLNEENAMRK